MIIGLTGSLAAGKGVVSDFLKKEGFVYLSLSDELREIAKQKKLEVTRENLQKLGNEMREQNGTAYLAKIVVDKIKNQQYLKAIVDGIRNPAEIEELKKLKNFFLIAVDAPAEIRFERMKSRDRESDPKTWEEFLKIDAKDKGVGESETGQGTGLCMAEADMTLVNEGKLEEVQAKIINAYKELQRKIPRPSWDEYFMKAAALITERSTCLRHHIGAVIVKDKRILTSGYNGAVSGAADCTQLGCLKDQQGLASGLGYETCRAVHAEQNAIVQAAVLGISVKSSTIYCTHTPCMICAKLIVNAGIKEVVSYQDFQGDMGARNFLINSGITLRKVPRPSLVISFKD